MSKHIGWCIRTRERTGAREIITSEKQTNALGKAKQTGYDGCSMRENKPKQKQFLSGREQANLHLFRCRSYIPVGLYATRRAHAVIQY